MFDDDLTIELDDFDDTVIPVSGKTAEALPLASPTMGGTLPTPVPYKAGLELVSGPGKLFDFSKSTLSPLQQLYIMGYATKGTRVGACQLTGVPYQLVNRWMEGEEFREAFQSAVSIVGDVLEEELMNRAMNGSDKLLLEAVKAAKSEKYNKKQADVNITGTMVHTWADLAKQAAIEANKADVKEAEFEEVKE